MSFASPGTGSAPHLVGELFKIVTGIPSVHVPYKGSGTAAPDLAAGNVQFMFDAIAGHQPFIQSGRVRALAVTSPARLAAFPDIPTMKELGFPRVDGTVWYGLLGAGRHAEERHREAQRRIEARPRHAGREGEAHARGDRCGGRNAGGIRKIIRAEFEKWGPVVKAAGVKAN